MAYEKVVSSNIDALKHEENRLFVRFLNGREYVYDQVDREVYLGVKQAESVGSAFHRLIKAHPERYPFTRLQ